MKTHYVVGKLDGNLVVVSDQGTIQPLSILEPFRIIGSSESEMIIGIRYWDAQWELWDYQIVTVKEGVNVTRFIERN